MEVYCRHCGRPIDYRNDEDFLGWYHTRVNMRHRDYLDTLAEPIDVTRLNRRVLP